MRFKFLVNIHISKLMQLEKYHINEDDSIHRKLAYFIVLFAITADSLRSFFGDSDSVCEHFDA